MNGPPGSLEPEGWLIETSAIVAVILLESEAVQFLEVLASDGCKTTAFNLFEASLAISSRKTLNMSESHALVAALVSEFAVEVVPISPEMIPHAVAARERYGRGRNGLNMGDCLSYAAAKHLGLKLLYKGDDFAGTDVNG